MSALCEQYAGRRAKRLLADALASRARRLLLYTDESAARIGASLGFDDASYFTRFFRRETGETPSAFRRAARKEPAGIVVRREPARRRRTPPPSPHVPPQ